MADELPHVRSLAVVEPPPGGLAKLREAIRADGDRRQLRLRWLAIAAPAVVIAALVLWPHGDRVTHEPQPEPVALPDPNVSPDFYWVASSPRRSTPTTAATPSVTYSSPPPVTVRELR